MSQRILKSKSLGGTATALLLAAAFSSVGTAPAQAQTTALYTGGGSFASKIYRDLMNCYGNHDGTDTTVGLTAPPATCNAASPYKSSVELLYLSSGSGRGLNAFVAEDTQAFNDGRLPDNPPVASTTSFGPFYGVGAGATWVPAQKTGTGGTNKFPKISFVGSDDPLNATQLGTYNTNAAAHGWGNANQVPALVGAVAIPFKPTADGFTEKGKKPAGDNATTNPHSSLVDFSTNTFCGIFTGVITDWSDHRIKADNGNVALVPGGVDGNTHPIIIVYRTDSSGTTFLFSNGFANQCNESGFPVPAQWQTDVNAQASHNPADLGDNSYFAAIAAAGHLPLSVAGSPGFVAVSGSGGVKSKINSTPGSIGYVSTDFVLPVDTTGPKAANLQTYASFHNGTPAAFRAPTSKNGTPIIGSNKPPVNKANSCPVGAAVGQSPDGNCAHNPLNWGLKVPKPLTASAYPLGGFTFIDTYTCYASATDVANLVGTTAGSLGYLRWYFGSATENSSLVKNALTANGFSAVPGSWLGGIKKLLTTDKVTKISQAGFGTVKTNPTCFNKVGGA